MSRTSSIDLSARAELRRRIVAQRIVEDMHPGQRRVCFAARVVGALATFVALLSPRRWGKSEGFLRYACWLCLTKPGARVLYVGLLKDATLEIVEPILRRLHREYGFRAKFSGFTASGNGQIKLVFDNGSFIRIVGADHPKFDRLFRGHEYDLVVIDEAQGFVRVDLLPMVRDVLSPTIDDRMGRMFMGGTPGDEEDGYFWETIEARKHKRWLVVKGKAFENPHNVEQLKAREAELVEEEGPDVVNEPWFLRERRGLWVSDNRRLVVKLSHQKGNFLREWKPAEGERYVLSAHFDFRGVSAYALAAWNPRQHNDLVFLQGWERAGMTMAEHVELITGVRDKVGRRNLRVIATTRNKFAKKTIEDLRRSYRLSIDEAPKGDEDLPTNQLATEADEGRLKIFNWADPEHPEESVIAQQWAKLSWQEDRRKKTAKLGEPRRVHAAAAALRRAVFPGQFRPKTKAEPTEAEKRYKRRLKRVRRDLDVMRRGFR